MSLPLLKRMHGAATAAVLAALLCTSVPGIAAPFAYITNQGSNDVSVIDLALQQVVATVPVGRAPAGVVAASRTGKVYVSNPDSRTISVIDMRTQRVVGLLPAGSGPVSNYTSTLSVSGDANSATVEWRGAFYRAYPNNDPPPDKNDEAAVKAVTGVYQSGLAHLKKLVEAQ